MSSIKIIVMGVGGVGKSAITNRFVIGRWVEKVRADKIVSWFELIMVLQINLVRSYRRRIIPNHYGFRWKGLTSRNFGYCWTR